MTTDQRLLEAAIAAAGLSDRKFATAVCGVNERTVRGWRDGSRPFPRVGGTTRQLLRAIVMYPPIVEMIRLDRGPQPYQIYRGGTQEGGLAGQGEKEAIRRNPE